MSDLRPALILAATIATAVPTTTDAGTLTNRESRRAECPKTYTNRMFAGASYQAYRGTRRPNRHQRRQLRRMLACPREPWTRRQDLATFAHFQRANARRRYDASHPWAGPVTASWFDDSGTTGCGFHTSYGFATLLPDVGCGQTIQMRGPTGVVIDATREDSGPYVSGRTFDLSPGLKAALGCGDLCQISYRLR